MKQFGKRMLAAGLGLLLAALAVVVVLPQETAVYAADRVRYEGEYYTTQTSGDWQYIVKGQEAVIMRYNGTVGTVTVPSALDGYPVTALGKDDYTSYNSGGAFEGNTSMQTVTIPSSVTYIDEEVFYGCTGLQQVLVGDGVEKIGEYAFYNCSALQRIQFKGSALKEIGVGAFLDCPLLNQVTLPESVTTIGNAAFACDTSLTFIKIPNSVTSLGAGAFAGCTALEEAVIGDGVPELSACGGSLGCSVGVSDYNGCFENCMMLKKVSIGAGVTAIGPDAFAGCTALTEAVLPDSVKTIGDGAFYQCAALKTVTLGNNVRTIGRYAFRNNTSLTEIVIPDSVSSLGYASFEGCTSLTKAVVGNGVTALGEDAVYNSYYGPTLSHGMFEGCSMLSEVVIGDGVTEIGADAFNGTALENVVIPDGVVSVGDGAFASCTKLQSVIIGDGVTQIGQSAFEGDIGLNNIHIGKSVVTIGYYALAGCTSLQTLIIPSNVTALGGAVCIGCSSLEKVIIGNGVPQLDYYRDHDHNYKFYGYSDYDGAFEGCVMLKEAALGSGLTTIGRDAFAGTALDSLLLPSKVSEIEKRAFYNCSVGKLYFTGSAPEIEDEENTFDTDVPKLYKIAGKTGYDGLGYTFLDFTPITVRFDLNDSDVFAITPSDQYVAPEGGYVIEPLEPIAEGYRFLGWYRDSACTQEWDFVNDKATEDMTLYAGWVSASEVAPEAPKALTCQTATGSTATMTWQAADGATGYYVYVDGVQATPDAVTECSYQIRNLATDTAYEVTVAAVNEKGVSAQSLVRMIWTAEEADEPEEPTAEPTQQPQQTQQPTAEPTQKPDPPVVSVLLGDVNGDGHVDATDALGVLRIVVKLSKADERQAKAADVTRDGKIEASDALQILKYVVKLVDGF